MSLLTTDAPGRRHVWQHVTRCLGIRQRSRSQRRRLLRSLQPRPTRHRRLALAQPPTSSPSSSLPAVRCRSSTNDVFSPGAYSDVTAHLARPPRGAGLTCRCATHQLANSSSNIIGSQSLLHRSSHAATARNTHHLTWRFTSRLTFQNLVAKK